MPIERNHSTMEYFANRAGVESGSVISQNWDKRFGEYENGIASVDAGLIRRGILLRFEGKPRELY